MKATKTATRKAMRERNKALLISAIRADIAAPVGCSWDELGTVLHACRAMAHRIINEAAFSDELARRDPRNQQNDGQYRVKPQTESYRAANRAVESWLDWAMEEKPEFAIKPHSAIVLGWSSRGHDNVERWHKDLKANRPARLPTMKKGAPIYVPRANWTLEENDGGLVLGLPLIAGRKFAVRLVAFKGQNWAALRGAAKGDVEAGALQIVYDETAKRRDGKRGRWVVKIPVKLPRPELKRGGGTLIVHRGQRNFLYLLPSTGASHGKPIAGTNIAEQKRRHEAMLREIKAGSNNAELGSGARGRGRNRRFRRYDQKRARLDLVLRMLCQQTTAEIVKLAGAWGCTRVVIEDYGGIPPHDERVMRRFLPKFPLYLLKQCIARACQKAGLVLEEVPAAYISTKCPQCKTVDATAHNERTGVFHCGTARCTFDGLADYVAALNMLTLIFPNEDTPVHDALRRSEELARKFRETKAPDNDPDEDGGDKAAE